MRVHKLEEQFKASLYGASTPETEQATRDMYNNCFATMGNQRAINFRANEELFDGERSLKELYGEWDGKNVMVCGAGPSLMFRMEQIWEAKRQGYKFVIVDRAVNFFKAMGLVPDLVVSIDPQPEVADMLPDDDWIRQTRWALYMISPRCMVDKIPKDRRWFFGSTNPCIDIWREVAATRPRFLCVREHLIVTYVAVEAAYWMGAKRVFTVGNDLLYQIKGWCPHCGCPDIKDVLKDRTLNEEVTLLQNNTHVTKGTFLQAARAFAHFPENYKDCEFIDIGGGLAKEGWGHNPQLPKD